MDIMPTAGNDPGGSQSSAGGKPEDKGPEVAVGAGGKPRDWLSSWHYGVAERVAGILGMEYEDKKADAALFNGLHYTVGLVIMVVLDVYGMPLWTWMYGPLPYTGRNRSNYHR